VNHVEEQKKCRATSEWNAPSLAFPTSTAPPPRSIAKRPFTFKSAMIVSLCVAAGFAQVVISSRTLSCGKALAHARLVSSDTGVLARSAASIASGSKVGPSGSVEYSSATM
jgi:hypothetical protein